MLNHDIGEMNSFSDTLIPFNIINMKDLFKKKKIINLLISKKKKKKKKFIRLHTIYRLYTPTTP